MHKISALSKLLSALLVLYLQANTLLPALENCLLELGAAVKGGHSELVTTWMPACCALLQRASILAQASSFLQLVGPLATILDGSDSYPSRRCFNPRCKMTGLNAQ